MEIVFHRVDDATHVLSIRDESVRCETRSYLLHDLVHYAVESAGRREDGFYGRLAAGATLAVMGDRETVFDGMATIEQVVAQVQSAVKASVDADAIFSRLATSAAAQGERLPAWVTVEMLADALEVLRRARGQWRATPHGSAMTLPWPGRLDET